MKPQLSNAIQATQSLVNDLTQAIEQVAFDRMTRLLYSTDASIYQMMPVGVVFPKNADEISAAIEIAAQHQVPVLPRGGGSSLCGNSIGHALILDLSRYMDQIITIDPEQRLVKTQPGITLGILNQSLAKNNLMFGPDPASADRATIGGIIGNNSAGARSIIYGMTHDHVLACDVLLSDGKRATFDSFEGDWTTRGNRPALEGKIYQTIPKVLKKYKYVIANRYPKTFRHVAGYNLHLLAKQTRFNLSQLLVGSEGTLGIVSEATLNLVPIPKRKRLALVHFDDLRASLEATPVILESNPTAIELLDKLLLDLTRDKVEYRRLLTFVEGDPQVILLVEFAGETESELDAGIQRLKAKLKQIRHSQPLVVVSDPAQQANVWYVRKVGLGIFMSVRGDTKPIPGIEDAAVPVEHLADYITELHQCIYEAGIEQIAMYAHASAGCIHVRPLINLKSKTGIRQLRQVGEKSLELVLKYNGTISGEHGDGLARSEFSEKLFGSELAQAFREIKATFDPQNSLNPGKVVDAPRIDDEVLMRYGSHYNVPQALGATAFSFTSEGSFASAVEMCNGAGVCRKTNHGVMCPSFQATRDETHSTRGRANALRSAMMGLLGPQGMTAKELYDVLDLCLSCQACKSECPSSVDMARLKAEFLHGYYQEHGIPWLAWIFANIGTLNRLGQPFAPLANALLAGPGKWLMNGLGVHSKRAMPKFAKQSFTTWFDKHHSLIPTRQESNGQVIFFHDTFMQHNQPHIGKAAVKVLETAGYQVTVLKEKRDSGRPAVSKGLLNEAKKLAKHNIDLLAPYARQGIPIVGCEPSSVIMLIEEYRDLVSEEDADNAKAVAQATKMLDQFIIQETKAGRLNLEFDETPRHVLFHGHCQQKATFGTQSVHQMLTLIPNCTVNEIDAGCCGMAGSFGYEKEHYDLSIQIAEISLAPAVRAAGQKTIICAMGTSCRDQIEHTTERGTLHPIEVLAAALK